MICVLFVDWLFVSIVFLVCGFYIKWNVVWLFFDFRFHVKQIILQKPIIYTRIPGKWRFQYFNVKLQKRQPNCMANVMTHGRAIRLLLIHKFFVKLYIRRRHIFEAVFMVGNGEKPKTYAFDLLCIVFGRFTTFDRSFVQQHELLFYIDQTIW